MKLDSFSDNKRVVVSPADQMNWIHDEADVLPSPLQRLHETIHVLVVALGQGQMRLKTLRWPCGKVVAVGEEIHQAFLEMNHFRMSWSVQAFVFVGLFVRMFLLFGLLGWLDLEIIQISIKLFNSWTMASRWLNRFEFRTGVPFRPGNWVKSRNSIMVGFIAQFNEVWCNLISTFIALNLHVIINNTEGSV